MTASKGITNARREMLATNQARVRKLSQKLKQHGLSDKTKHTTSHGFLQGNLKKKYKTHAHQNRMFSVHEDKENSKFADSDEEEDRRK